MVWLNEICKKRNESEIDLFHLQKRCLGPLYKDKVIYFIEEDNGSLGFFAMYRAWLEYIYFADICGYTPVVCGGKHFLYKEEKQICSTDNPFEYYFEQPTTVKVQEAQKSRNVIMSDLNHRKMVELIFTGKTCHYKYNKKYLCAMAQVVRKYVRFNKTTWEYVEKGWNKINIHNQKVLGVHIRGTDFRAEYNNHPVYVTEDECFEKIDEVFYKNKYEKIFLATDDQRILKKFIEKYQDNLCFYNDVERGDRNKSIAFESNDRINHKYRLGLEVIRDMYTLSKCDGLIAGVSQVAVCAQINKLARKEWFSDRIIIDKGINKNNHEFIKHH